MQEVSVDLANAEPGETCFLLQLRVPDVQSSEGGALVDKISHFVGLYLSTAQPLEVRYAQMGALNWMIAAPEAAWTDLNALRADLAATLFGAEKDELVQLEAPGLEAPEPLEDVELPDDEAAVSESDSNPIQDDATERDDDVWVEDGAPTTPSSDEIDALEGQEVFVVDAEDAPSTVEDFDIESSGFEPAAGAPDLPVDDDDDDADWEIAGATAARRAAFDDESDIFEVDGLDIEIVDADTLDVADIGAVDDLTFDAPPETLTETPPRPVERDIASELAAFRAEMREIASGIPAGDGDAALASFRAELDAIAGSVGQRVDGAAQRIEAAADRIADVGGQLDGARLNDAAARAETSAARLEKGVEEALSALNAAVKAMAGAPLSDAVEAGG